MFPSTPAQPSLPSQNPHTLTLRLCRRQRLHQKPRYIPQHPRPRRLPPTPLPRKSPFFPSFSLHQEPNLNHSLHNQRRNSQSSKRTVSAAATTPPSTPRRNQRITPTRPTCATASTTCGNRSCAPPTPTSSASIPFWAAPPGGGSNGSVGRLCASRTGPRSGGLVIRWALCEKRLVGGCGRDGLLWDGWDGLRGEMGGLGSMGVFYNAAFRDRQKELCVRKMIAVPRLHPILLYCPASCETGCLSVGRQAREIINGTHICWNLEAHSVRGSAPSDPGLKTSCHATLLSQHIYNYLSTSLCNFGSSRL